MWRKPKLTPHQKNEARQRIAKSDTRSCEELRRLHHRDFEVVQRKVYRRSLASFRRVERQHLLFWTQFS